MEKERCLYSILCLLSPQVVEVLEAEIMKITQAEGKRSRMVFEPENTLDAFYLGELYCLLPEGKYEFFWNSDGTENFKSLEISMLTLTATLRELVHAKLKVGE